MSRAEFSHPGPDQLPEGNQHRPGDRFGSSAGPDAGSGCSSLARRRSRAWRDGVDGNQSDNSGNAVGAAYLYEQTSAGVWSATHYLKAANADNGDRFGAATASFMPI